jgi:succinyl-CoA synthetase beta subunit
MMIAACNGRNRTILKTLRTTVAADNATNSVLLCARAMFTNVNTRASTKWSTTTTTTTANGLKNRSDLGNERARSKRNDRVNKIHRRFLNVHEYQGADLMRKFGVRVPDSVACFTIDEVVSASEKMRNSRDDEVVIKSQILAGGRGLGQFKNGFKGGVHIVPISKAKETAEKMLGNVLVTKQSGEQGKPVNALLVAKKMKFAKEMYFAILLDRKSAKPMIIASAEGGTSIEDLAESHPEKIIKKYIDINSKEIPKEDATDLAIKLGCSNVEDAAKQFQCLYETFRKTDCTMIEVNPMAETTDGELYAADAKLNFDENAEYRQKEIFSKRDSTQEDAREVEAQKYDLNYIGLDGNIGCMVNGAGLAMATMDIIQGKGGSPANFLDVGGNASEEQVVEAFKILNKDPKVKAILVNIFGGIMKCDVIASGIVNAVKVVGLNIPLVVRLEGTNVEEGRRIMEQSGVNIVTAKDLDDAADKAVKAII